MSDSKELQQRKEALARKHKAERKDLRKACNDALSGKKGDERTAIERENEAKTEALAAQHAAEIQALEEGTAEEQDSSAAVSSTSSSSSSSKVTGTSSSTGQTKAQRRREKEKEKERELERRKEEIRKEAGPSERDREMEHVKKMLDSLGLELKEVQGDGHCMYRAVADQLIQQGGSSITSETKDPHLMLRVMCAQYMKEHRHEFEPFLAAETDEPLPFDKYLDRVKNSADWGGQLELRALAGVLQTPIRVIDPQAFKPLVMGEDNSGKPITVTYHRHFLTLGEHYNSVQPKVA